jgi:hypothetical protein
MPTLVSVPKTLHDGLKTSELQWLNSAGDGAAALDLGIGELTITRAYRPKQSRSTLSPGGQ